MIVLEIPGYGEVEVDTEEDLAKLKKQLDAHFQKTKKAVDEQQQVPKEILKALDQLRATNEALMKALSEQVKVQPVIRVDVPEIKYTPPEVKVNVQAPVVNVESPELEVILPDMEMWSELTVEFDVTSRDSERLIKSAKMNITKNA